jgi:8-oxo-dGTP pyrophosphatase MutT (NUDIX family)
VTEPAIRPAATVILVRGGTRVLMGQRGAGAAFMPSKFVFPGGAVDPADADVTFARPLMAETATRLSAPPVGPSPSALCAAAIRELWEEAGLTLARPTGRGGVVPEEATGLNALGLRPDAGALRFVFRAITPRGRPHRFDARFFLAEATDIHGDPDDFSAASDELSHLHWVPLDQARRLDLPFITEVVLAEVAHLLRGNTHADGVPFFDSSGDTPVFRRLL